MGGGGKGEGIKDESGNPQVRMSREDISHSGIQPIKSKGVNRENGTQWLSVARNPRPEGRFGSESI